MGTEFVVPDAPTWWRPLLFTYAIVLVGWLGTVKIFTVGGAGAHPLLVGYGLLVLTFMISRALLATQYRAVPNVEDDTKLPRLAVIVPCFNEGEGIVRTVRSILAADYPRRLLKIVVVDDCSTDNSLELAAQAAAGREHVTLLRLAANSGKRAAMAAGLQHAQDAEMVLFVDSDTTVERSALRAGVAPLLANARVGAVTGHADVSNADRSFLARLQQARYFVAFRIIKAAESLTGSVICASGCFSVYRVNALQQVLPDWEGQRFLGKPATFGDDRALTTMLLRAGWKVVYQSTARTMTTVPTRWRQWWRQQLRWKKSWTRESLLLGAFAWRLTPPAIFSIYAGIVMTLAGPVVLVYFTLYRPLTGAGDPWLYLTALYVLALLYGLLYGVARNCAPWWRGTVFALGSAFVMGFQVYWAMVRSRDTGWGTRASAVGPGSRTVAVTFTGAEVHVPGRELTPPVTVAVRAQERFASGAVAVALTAAPLAVYSVWLLGA